MIKRLLEQQPLLGILLATGLALLPLLNWVGMLIIVLMVLRCPGWLPSVGFVLVSLASYLGFSGYSIEFAWTDWLGVVAMFLPLWVMAWSLRTTRALSFALELGFAALVLCLLLQVLIFGQPNVQTWVDFFRCRLAAVGLSETDLVPMLSGQSFEQAVRGMMLGWPFAFFSLQIGLLMLARWWQAKLYYPGGFQTEFHQMRLHKPVALGMAFILLVLSVIGIQQPVLIQFATVGLLLLLVPGLGFVHWYLKFKAFSRWWLLLVYGILFVSSFAALPALAMIAVVDSGLDLRVKLSKQR